MLDAIVEASDREAAVDAITGLLGTSRIGSEAVDGNVVRPTHHRFAAPHQEELDDLQQQAELHPRERPASSDDNLQPVRSPHETDRDIGGARTTEAGAAGDGSGSPAGQPGRRNLFRPQRLNAEEAAWFVAVDGDAKVGMVSANSSEAKSTCASGSTPEHRKKGYGTSALRKSRSELAAAFPAVPLVVRAPGVI